MSSATPEWSTPQDFFDALNKEFGPFTLDVCANEHNTKCKTWYGANGASWVDGLSQPWTGKVWMNPPYGRGIGAWVKKAYESSQAGATVVCLLPSRTDTKWFHNYCTKGVIRFVPGRLKFGGHKNAAPFPSMVVIFKPNDPNNDPIMPKRQ